MSRAPQVPPDPEASSFRSTLVKVMAMQVASLVALWILQVLYTR